MTYANQITLFRILLVPVVVWAMVSGYWKFATIAFAFAGLSDALDGFLARKYGQKTALGAFLDPAADKFLMLSAVGCLWSFEVLPLWLVLLIFFRDILIILGVVVSYFIKQPIAIEPLLVSKMTTFFQIQLIGGMLFFLGFDFKSQFLEQGLIYCAALFTFVSLLAYVRVGLRHLGVWTWG